MSGAGRHRGVGGGVRERPAVRRGGVRTPPSVRACLAAYELALSVHALNPAAGWPAAVRAALRPAFRGRVDLAHTSPDAADRMDRWLDARLGAAPA
jgi:hypothetical protein